LILILISISLVLVVVGGGRGLQVEGVKAEGGEAVYVKADVSKAGDCENMVQVAEKTFGKVNILFNNAGIMHGDDNGATDTEEKIWDLTMNVNAKGVFFGCTLLSTPPPVGFFSFRLLLCFALLAWCPGSNVSLRTYVCGVHMCVCVCAAGKYGIPALRRAGGGSIINVRCWIAPSLPPVGGRCVGWAAAARVFVRSFPSQGFGPCRRRHTCRRPRSWPSSGLPPRKSRTRRAREPFFVRPPPPAGMRRRSGGWLRPHRCASSLLSARRSHEQGAGGDPRP
jgi:hypothetical protein